MIIEIRGCTGSGKSTLIQALMSAAGEVTVLKSDRRGPEAYQLHLGHRTVIVLGSYRQRTGGLENRYSTLDCIRLLQTYIPRHACVMFEGGMLSKSTGPVYEWLIRHYRHRYMVVWMNVTVDQCVRNLRRRRETDTVNRAPIQRDMRTCERALARILKDDKIPVIQLTPFPYQPA